MAGDGPAPKHPSVRRRRNASSAGSLRSLPRKGRSGAAPKWPLAPDVVMSATLEHQRDKISGLQLDLDQAEDGRSRGRIRRDLDKLEISTSILALRIEQSTDAEVELWSSLWSIPQAVMWEESHAHREVAVYVRCQIRAEQGDLKAATEARQRGDRLGVNPLALLKLRAEIERVDEAEQRGTRRRSTPPKGKPKKGEGDDPRGGLFAVS